MIDTHCHLTFPKLYERVDEVIQAAHAAGVDRMISVGTTPEDARTAAALAPRFPGVYASVGLHPHYATPELTRDELADAFAELLPQPGVVAMGEMGLDYHYPDPPRDLQKRVFEWQLELAVEHTDVPIIIHNRNATDDVLAMIRSVGLPGSRFVFHCFTGSPIEVEQILAIGAMVSFTGIVTFKNAGEIAEAFDRVPLDRVMIETDSPYLAPEPYRKVRPNEPRYVPHVAQFLADRRNMPLNQFVQAVDANAVRFFQLPVIGS